MLNVSFMFLIVVAQVHKAERPRAVAVHQQDQWSDSYHSNPGPGVHLCEEQRV